MEHTTFHENTMLPFKSVCWKRLIYMGGKYSTAVSGLAYMKQCDIEKYIPIYLIVAGGVGIFKAVLQCGLLILK